MSSVTGADWASLVAAAAAIVSAVATGFGVVEAARLRRLAVTPVLVVDRTTHPEGQWVTDHDHPAKTQHFYRIRNVGQGAGLIQAIAYDEAVGITAIHSDDIVGRVLTSGEDLVVQVALDGDGAAPKSQPTQFKIMYQSARGNTLISRITFDPSTGTVLGLDAPPFAWSQLADRWRRARHGDTGPR